MGLLDKSGLIEKVKAQANVLADTVQTGVQQGQVKLAELQAVKRADHLLREIGAYTFLAERGRPQPGAAAKVTELMEQLDALEAAGTVVSTDSPSVDGDDENTAAGNAETELSRRIPR